MKIINIKDNTFCIDTGNSYIPFYKVNKDEIIMLDTGLKEERVGIEELLDKNNFKVIGIVCTHAHIDHTGNNAYLKEKYNCIIAMPIFSSIISKSIYNLKLYYGSQTIVGAIKYLKHMVSETDISILNEQKSVNVCGVEFLIVHTHGHSPDHICIITPDDVAYLGDSLISYDVMEKSKIPYAYALTEDLRSKQMLYDFKNSKYVTAHKGCYDDITQLIDDNINFYKSRAENIYEVLGGPMTMDEIIKNVAEKLDISINNIFKHSVIERMIEAYIEYLCETDRLEVSIIDGFLKYKKVN